jgi:hypothetical protein
VTVGHIYQFRTANVRKNKDLPAYAGRQLHTK